MDDGFYFIIFYEYKPFTILQYYVIIFQDVLIHTFNLRRKSVGFFKDFKEDLNETASDFSKNSSSEKRG